MGGSSGGDGPIAEGPGLWDFVKIGALITAAVYGGKYLVKEAEKNEKNNVKQKTEYVAPVKVDSLKLK